MSNNVNWRSFVNLCAYIAIVMIGVALILSKIISGSEVVAALNIIANVLSYIIVGIAAYCYAASKRNFWYFAIWLVAIVLIVVFYFL